MNEIKKILGNEQGSVFIWLIIFIFIFVSVCGLGLDFKNLQNKSDRVKMAVNKSVKAATLPVQEGEDLANGVFKIEEVRSEENFYKILSKNLKLDEITLEPLENSIISSKPIIKELEVENDAPTDYDSPTLSRQYHIEYPSVIAVLEIEIKSVFLKKKLKVAKLSSSQLTSIYD